MRKQKGINQTLGNEGLMIEWGIKETNKWWKKEERAGRNNWGMKEGRKEGKINVWVDGGMNGRETKFYRSGCLSIENGNP